MRNTILIAGALSLAACAGIPSIHGADRRPDGSMTLTFIGGYSRSDAMRGMVHRALEAQPDGSTLTLGANGCLYLTDEEAIAIVQRKAFRVVDTPISGCDGRVILPPPYKRAQP